MDELSVKENGGRAYEDHEISYQEFHDYYDLGTNHFSKIGGLYDIHLLSSSLTLTLLTDSPSPSPLQS